MFTHILGSTQRKDVKRHDLFWDGAAQVDWCIDQKMEAEDIYLSLSRNIQNVCLGQHTKTPFFGVFFSPLSFDPCFFCLGSFLGSKKGE